MFGAGRGRSTRIADTVQVGAERDGKSVEERGGGIGKGRQTEDWRPTARCVRPLRGGSVQCTVANIDEPFQIQCEHTHKAKKRGEEEEEEFPLLLSSSSSFFFFFSFFSLPRARNVGWGAAIIPSSPAAMPLHIFTFYTIDWFSFSLSYSYAVII